MTDKVTLLPGIERRDLAGQPVPSAEVLRSAIDKGITDVVIVGRQRDGTLYVAAETNDADRCAGILTRAVGFVAGGYYGDSRSEHSRADGEKT